MSNHFWDWPTIHSAQSMRRLGMTWERIGALFGRPAAEVMVKLEKVERGNLDHIAWSYSDDAVVRAHHHLGVDAVVAALEASGCPRASRRAVYQRCRTLGLPCPRIARRSA